MGFPQLACAAAIQGMACWHEPVVAKPIPLCRPHLAAVMHQATQLFVCMDTVQGVADLSDEDRICHARVLSIPTALAGSHEDAVYFIRNGNRVKIGYTTNLSRRLMALSQRRQDVVLLLAGDRKLEAALHRYFRRERLFLTEWFEYTGELERFLQAQEVQVEELRKESLRKPRAETVEVRPELAILPVHAFPDGTPVTRSMWCDLYGVFVVLCKEKGYATKAELTDRGPYDSRDTVRRACDMWVTRGVQVRKVNRTNQFYLPEPVSEDN